MADQQANFSRVVSLLRQAECLLSGVSDNDSAGTSNNTSPSSRPASSASTSPTVANDANVESVPSVATTSTNVVQSQTNADRCLQNFRSLFSSYNRGSFRPNSARGSLAPPPKRKRNSTLSQFVPKDTWTHDFLCLADRYQDYQPTRGQKCELQLAGLGRKKIVFKKDANASAFVAKIEEYFPKLQSCGGFDILRSGASNKNLVVISPPPSGYSVPFLREASGLGQALAYIRPLQCSLNMSTPEISTSSQVFLA